MARAAAPLAVAASLLLAACDDAGPASPLPATRDPNQTVTLSPATYLLRPDQMPGYDRTQSDAVSAGFIAAEYGDPSLAAKIEGQGLAAGTRYEYGPPSGAEASTPFLNVISQALIFAAPSGAIEFFADEQARQNASAQSGGTVTPIAGLATVNADEVAGLSEAGSPDNAGAPPQAYLVLARHGRVVVELFAAGEVASATRARLDALLAAQESQMGHDPEN